MADEVKMQSCVVCGMGSHRTEWSKTASGGKGTKFVACDSHSDEEVKKAALLVEPKPVATQAKSDQTPAKP